MILATAFPLPTRSITSARGVSGLVAEHAETAVHRRPEFSAVRLFVATSTVLAAGVLVAMLTTPDPLWWQLNFSHLGTFAGFSSEVFNASLAIAGLFLVFVARRAHVELHRHAARSRSHPRSPRILSLLLASFGAHLAAVGLLPVNIFGWVHELAACGTTLSFVGLLIATPALVRGLGRSTVTTTVPAGILLAGGYAAMATGACTLAAFELIGFTTIFIWLTHFLGCLTPGSATSIRWRRDPRTFARRWARSC